MKPAIDIRNDDWPEAIWDVSGIFANDRELIYFHDYFLNHFGLKPFSLVHGSPLSTWNSGRVLPHLLRSGEELELCIKSWQERKVAMDLTFSNPFLTEENLKEALGNSLLEVAERVNPTGENGVIMSSDLLYQYIKKRYPKVKTVSSILKVTMEKGGGNLDYYKRLADLYDKVMLHPNDNDNYELLEKLEDKNKYEIIVNENCARQCAIRHKHYESLSKMALNFLGHTDNFDDLRNKNACAKIDVLLGTSSQCTTQLSREEMKTLYDMGFRRFKVQGRGLGNAGGEIMDLLRLILKKDDGSPVSTDAIIIRFLESMREII